MLTEPRHWGLLGILVLLTPWAARAAEFDLSWFTIDGGGIMNSQGGEFELSGTIGQADAGKMQGGDFELIGGFWAVAAASACSETGPLVVHAQALPTPAGSTAASSPCTGYIDPRAESTDGTNANLGVDQVVFVFNEPVVAIGGGALGADDFVVTQTGVGAPPVVAGVEPINAMIYRVMLDRIVTLQEWTTIRARVQNLCGAVISDAGNQGPGALEPDRIDIGRLPADVNNDSQVTPTDLINLRRFIAGMGSAPCGANADYYDIDRDGTFPLPVDLIRFRQLLAGTGNATRSWAGVSMLSPQP